MKAEVESVRTVCSYCGVGCGILLDIGRDASTGRRIAKKVSGDRTHPANSGRLCTKGATSADMMAAPGRAAKALIRAERGADPVEADVDAAITAVAGRLRAIVDEHGPDALALYVSGQMSLEAQYLANKLAKGFVRTSRIESNSRLCMASAGSGYKLSLGADGPPGSYRDFDRADVFFVIGANMADCHPILFLRMMERIKSAGARLIVVDPRRNATADKADLFLQIEPGTDLALLNGILYLLVENGHTDEEFIAEFTDGWEEMPSFLADHHPARVAGITGVPEADIRQAARWIGEAGEWMSCWTMGLNQSTHGTWNTNALVNLHLATGAICRPGSGPFSLTGQPNAMGGREMGYMGPGLPGQRSVLVDEERAFIEDLWGVEAGTLRTEAGRGTVEMFEQMAAGDIKACWIICTNPVASVANRRTVIAGLEAAELVVTQDVFADTETNAYADVVLPATLWAESDGVMINSERNLTLVQGVVDPPGQALPDWQLIARVACAMGYADAFTYTSAEEVFEELKRAWNPKTGWDLRGVTYQRLRETPVQWPAASPAGDDRNPSPACTPSSSSPLTHPAEVRVTVSVVRYTNDLGRDRKGVCSTYLADCADDGPVQVYVQRSPHFRPPTGSTTPMIMIGPGTGVAPFIGFLEDRLARGHTGPNWLFFGEQHEATDFYYREDLEDFVASGHLDRLDVAFSRDQRNKVYVQDRMREHGPRLWRWLQDGAHLYVCGDAGRMAKDVDRALHEIVAAHGGMDQDAAAACVAQLATDKRYVRDVY
ncbi:Periplasmic nitrate reductase [Streptomyces microflavus]